MDANLGSAAHSAGTECQPAAKRHRSWKRGQGSRAACARKNAQPAAPVEPVPDTTGTVEDSSCYVTDLPVRVVRKNTTCGLCGPAGCSATFARRTPGPAAGARARTRSRTTCTLPDPGSRTHPHVGTTTRHRPGTKMPPVPCTGTRSDFSSRARPDLDGTRCAACIPVAYPANFARIRPVLATEGSGVRGDLDCNGDSIVSEIQDMTISQPQGERCCATVPPIPAADWSQTSTRRRRSARCQRKLPTSSATSAEPVSPHSSSTMSVHSFSAAPVHSCSTAPVSVPDKYRAPAAITRATEPVSRRSTLSGTDSDGSPKQTDAGANSSSAFFVRRLPPPALEWSDPVNLWSVMSKKEARYQHSSSLLEYHTSLRPRDRAIVLEWLMAVCEVNQFNKETFFLATDLFDRFLLKYANVSLSRLQLVGTTALFIAAKAEEKTAPLASDYAELTEGACTEEDIIQCEVILLKTLSWNVVPVTVIAWLTFYLQLIDLHQSQKKWLDISQHDMTYPRYSKNTFLQASRLLDLCILDVRSLEFKYSVLAACAVYHALSDVEAIVDVVVPGIDQHQFPKCLSWMAVFADVLQEAAPLIHAPACSSVDPADVHLVQRHTVTLDMLDKAMGCPEWTSAA